MLELSRHNLISVPSKLFMRIFLNRIKPKLQEKLCGEQAGKEVGVCAPNILLFHVHGKGVGLCVKRRDVANYKALWYTIYNSEASQEQVQRYQQLCSTRWVDGDWFSIQTGLRQGCVISPSMQ